MKTRGLLLPIILALSTLPAAAQSNEMLFTVRLMPAVLDAETELINETGTRVSYESAAALGLGCSYMATDHFGVELAVSAAEHDMEARGGDYSGQDGGSTWIIPVTLSLRYHLPMYGDLHPYFGAGLNVTWFEGYTVSDDFANVGVHDFESDTSLGFVVQAGLDYDLGEKWAATVDLKYLDIANDTDIVHTSGSTLSEIGVDGSLVLFSIGASYRF